MRVLDWLWSAVKEIFVPTQEVLEDEIELEEDLFIDIVELAKKHNFDVVLTKDGDESITSITIDIRAREVIF